MYKKTLAFLTILILAGSSLGFAGTFYGPTITLMTKPQHWLVSVNGDSGPFAPAELAVEEFCSPPLPFTSPLSMNDLLPTEAAWITHPENPHASTMQFRGLVYLGNEFLKGDNFMWAHLTLAANDCVTKIRIIKSNGDVTQIKVPPCDTCAGGTGPFFIKFIPRNAFGSGYNMVVIDIENIALAGSVTGVLELFFKKMIW